MQQILSPHFTQEGFEAELQAWETKVVNYSKIRPGEITDETLKAVIMNHIPYQVLQMQLQMAPDTSATYDVLLANINDYTQKWHAWKDTRSATRDTGGVQDMELCYINKGGKGRGKGRGKSRGKGRQSSKGAGRGSADKIQGNCWHGNKPSHKSENCWAKAGDD